MALDITGEQQYRCLSLLRERGKIASLRSQ